MKYKIVFFIILFALTGCITQREAEASRITTTTATPKNTSTATRTNTPVMPSTPNPTGTSTSSFTPTQDLNTPLPTIPTFTPTFNVNNIVTVTPANGENCPDNDADLLPWFPACSNYGCLDRWYYEDVQAYLNQGGSLDNLQNYFGGYVLDLTGDGKRDFLFRDFDAVMALACKNGKYEIILEQPPDQNAPLIEHIEDLNRNGIPEIVLSYFERYQFSYIRILEWDGKDFVSLIDITMKTYSIDFLGTDGWDFSIIDTNNDNLKEIIMWDDLPMRPNDLAAGLPWRKSQITLGWNGQNFVIVNRENITPEYRFQAVQDGDRASRNQEFDKAMAIYQEAIFNKQLDWWSKERRDYESEISFYTFIAGMGGGGDTPSPTITPPPLTPPTEDFTEYDQLAAYAYYRMIVLHVLRDEMNAAEKQYLEMQEKYSAGSPGHPYLEMTSDFLDAYQVNQNITAACGAAINYAVKNPSILIPLGSDYHGWQSIDYKPEDVCPFR